MKLFDIKRSALLLACAAGAVLLPDFASAARFDSLKNNKAKPVREFRGQKPWHSASSDLNARLNNNSRRHAAVDNPSVSFDNLERFDYLEGPDGATWFYTTDYVIEEEVISEWYTEERITAYTFTIYDSTFKKVGEIKDKITLQPGESKVAHAVLDPSVSRHFFNDDNLPEVMVYLAMNTSAAFDYDVHYYNKVYSIGGQKDADGNDVCLTVLPGRCVDSFNAADAGNENLFYSFADDIYPDPSDFDISDFLGYINAAKTQITIFGKSKGDNQPELVYTKDIFMTRYPGDTTDGIYMITKYFNNTPYFIFSYYEKPYFIDPTGFATDENATPDNSLVIEVFSFDGNMNPVSTTKIPVEIKEVEGQVAYTFYSIGSVAWKNDVDMSVNGTPSKPAFIVTLDNTTAANLDDVGTSFKVYDNDGRLLHSLAEDTDGIAVLHSEEGHQPHALIVELDANDQYTFHFVDLYSGEKAFSLSQSNNNDPLTAVCERIMTPSGSYKYAFEMQYDDLDEDKNDIKRIAWYNQDGSFDRIDRINMLQGVMYSTINMYDGCLSPTLFDNDDAMEYAVLIKREYGNTTRNEFMVSDDNGSHYALFSEDDARGLPMTFSIIHADTGNKIQMIYNNDDTYNVDIYDLPFTNASGVENIIADNDSSIGSNAFDGENIRVAGALIRVYNTNGVKVAEGYDSVSLKSLPRGLYVAVATDEKGNQSALKIAY